MKKLTIVVLAFAVSALAQTQPPPAAPQPQAGAQGQTAAPAAPAGIKRQPQAKTQEEFTAYKQAAGLADAAALEKAANDFAAKYPDSELRILLYKAAMRAYQNANNPEKMREMGEKALALDPNDPEALVTVAMVLSEGAHTTDIDFAQKTDQAMSMARKALSTVDTDLEVPPNLPPDKIATIKNGMKSWAYAVIGTIELEKNDYAAAANDLNQSNQLNPMAPDPVTYLRLAVALDKQNKYPEALAAANRAVELAPETTDAGKLARQERDRLQKLTGSTGPMGPATTAGAGAPPSQQKPQPSQTTPPK
ncbi:MAG TPA: tetratricopeptide repeat protein [Terriglobales bacterium]|nr:tetratricopeptide repeat protein [Terriglobales bacterium]